MPLQSRISTVHMISVHEEEDGLYYDIPNVLPGKFWIPPISATAQIVKERCKTAVRIAGTTSPERLQYAHIKNTTEEPVRKYVLLTIPEATTFRYSTDKQTLDEYNQRMFPDIGRAALYVKPEQVANDIERAFGALGVIAITSYDGNDAPTQVELKRSREAYKAWMIKRINETNKNYAQHGFAEVTKQTLNIVNRLYRDHMIPALPTWASINPDIGMSAGQTSCEVCHGVIQAADVKCPKCGAIYNWKRAVEYGLVTEANVPKAKRREAGLEGPVEDTPMPKSTPVVIGSLPENAAVAIIQKDGGARTIAFGEPSADLSDQSFGGEQIRGHNDPEHVVEAVANLDEGEVSGASRGKVVRKSR